MEQIFLWSGFGATIVGNSAQCVLTAELKDSLFQNDAALTQGEEREIQLRLKHSRGTHTFGL